MGRRGPAQTHSKILQMRGTMRKDRHGSPGLEPAYAPLLALPPAPGFLDDVGAYEWGRVGSELVEQRLLTEVALAAFTGYCMNVQRMVEAHRECAGGVTVETEFGPKAHPAVMIARQAGAEALKFAKEFGLTPASLTRVKVPDTNSAPAEDPWATVAGG